MLIRNMLLKFYAPESGGEGSSGGGIEITPEIQKLIDERVTSEVTGLKSKTLSCWEPLSSKRNPVTLRWYRS